MTTRHKLSWREWSSTVSPPTLIIVWGRWGMQRSPPVAHIGWGWGGCGWRVGFARVTVLPDLPLLLFLLLILDLVTPW